MQTKDIVKIIKLPSTASIPIMSSPSCEEFIVAYTWGSGYPSISDKKMTKLNGFI